MSHPYGEHRQHKAQHARVGHLTGEMHGGRTIPPHVMGSAKKRASGGRVDGQRDAVAVTGEPVRQRLDRPMRAKGGRTKHKGTTVNIIAGGHPPMAAPMAGPGVAPSLPAAPAVPPRPPMAPPMAGAAPMPPGGMPSGSPIRKTGGRAYASGGAVKSGPTWNSSRAAGTQVQNTNNKLDGHNVGRGQVVTYKTGGAVEAPGHGTMRGAGGVEPRGAAMKTKKSGSMIYSNDGPMGPKVMAGGNSGLGRLAKARRAAHG